MNNSERHFYYKPRMEEIKPDPERYTPVDMLYNIGKIEGGQPRGFDVIDKATNARLYFTTPADQDAERIVKKELGDKAILPLTRNEDYFSVYSVTDGARLLIKSLEASPYQEAYMKKLKQDATEFINKIKKLDKNAFGIKLSDIAIQHNGPDNSSDDIYLSVVPPLKTSQ